MFEQFKILIVFYLTKQTDYCQNPIDRQTIGKFPYYKKHEKSKNNAETDKFEVEKNVRQS